MNDSDVFDLRLQQFLAAESRRADAYASRDQMIGVMNGNTLPRAGWPSRSLALALLVLTLLLALALSAVLLGSQRRLDNSQVIEPRATLETTNIRPIPSDSSIVALASPSRPIAASASPNGIIKNLLATSTSLLVYAKGDEVHVFDVDTGSDVVIAYVPGAEHSLVGWSGNGERITFDDGSLARSIAADGSDLIVVPSGPVGTWSPDGENYAAAYDTTVHIRDSSGAIAQYVDAPAGSTSLRWLEWSPDGQSIAAVVNMCGNDLLYCDFAVEHSFAEYWNGPSHYDDLWVLQLDGTSPFQLYEAPRPGKATSITLLPSLGDDWSPDSSYLAEVHNDSCDGVRCYYSTKSSIAEMATSYRPSTTLTSRVGHPTGNGWSSPTHNRNLTP
jgi:hypothetical protein